MSARSTFRLKVNGKEVAPPTYQPYPASLEETLKECDIATEKKGELLFSTKPENAVYAPLDNSFVGTLYQAYSSHLKVELRPDDVWLAIALAFADYVDHHAEEMRSSFVTFDGKKQLVVDASSCALNVDNWAGIVAQFSQLIDENTVGSVRDWIEPKFSKMPMAFPQVC